MPAFPTGMILLWAGSIVDIPAGYVLCDGNNGTPDLRDRFIVGAGSSYAVNDSGGALNHNHPFTGDGHFHTFAFGATFALGIGVQDQTTTNQAVGTTDNADHLPPHYALIFMMKT